MEDCNKLWKNQLTETVFLETRSQTQNDKIIEEFKKRIEKGENLILFAVSNAKFSEGFTFVTYLTFLGFNLKDNLCRVVM